MNIKTKYGTASISNQGYYYITTNEYGFRNQLLHRLIMADAIGCGILSNYVVHHIDGDKLNNDLSNLELLTNEEHTSLHHKGKDGYWKDKNFSDEHKLNISKSMNTTGYFRVSKSQCKSCKQGFMWAYIYLDENGKRKEIKSVDIKKLEEKIKTKGLEWRKL